MKRLLSHQAIFDLNQAIRKCKFSGHVSTSFRYALRRNLDATTAEVDAMVDAFKPDAEYVEYHTKLGEIAKKYDIENIDDIKAANNVIASKSEGEKAEFIKMQTDLADKYKDALERQHTIDDELNKFLLEKIEIDLIMVPVNEMPETIENEDAFILFDHLYPMIIQSPEDVSLTQDVPYEYK